MGKKMRLDQILSLDDLMVQEATVVDKPTRLTGVWERKHGKRAQCKRFIKTGFFSKFRLSGIEGKEQQRLEQEIVSQLDCLMEEEPASRESVLRAVLGLDRLPKDRSLCAGNENWESYSLEPPKFSFLSCLAAGNLNDFFKSLPEPRQDYLFPDGPEFCM
jgi:hypothetical protein